MKFGIAARQPADVAIVGGGFVRQRREWSDLGATAAPAIDDVTISKGERPVMRDGNALSRRRQRRRRCVGLRGSERAGAVGNPVQLHMLRHEIGNDAQPAFEIGGLARLHQSQMPRRQFDAG